VINREVMPVRAAGSLLLVFAVVSLAAVYSTACPRGKAAPPEQLSSLNDVRIGMPEGLPAASKSLFFYDQHGHFGDKVQYNSTTTDSSGGTYIIHCRGGKCIGVEVKYPSPGTTRETAVSVMNNLLKGVAPRLSERDDDDLRLHDCKLPGEFFYFGDRVRAEICYKDGTDVRVSQVNVWSN